jgi:hypothetical protein
MNFNFGPLVAVHALMHTGCAPTPLCTRLLGAHADVPMLEAHAGGAHVLGAPCLLCRPPSPACCVDPPPLLVVLTHLPCP